MTKVFRIAAILTAVVLGLAAPAEAKKCGAESFASSAGAAFFAAANSGSPQAFTNVASRYADLRGIALFALGQHRSKLPKAREAEYFGLARGYMGKFIAKYAGQASGGSMTVTDCTASGKSLLVKAKTSGGKSVAFRISKSGSGYRIQDVSLSSFWLASQLRGKFVRVINARNGDIDAIFAFLKSGAIPGS